MICAKSGNGGGASWGCASAIFASLLMVATPAYAQSGAQQDSVGEDAVDALTQPLTDLNLRKKDIPLILQLAQNAPYSLEYVPDCASMRDEVARLDEVLGPDADAEQESAGLINRGLRVGGNVLGGMIPFRGIVRRVSGARAEEKRWDAAIYGGVTRRSFLKGYLAATDCPVASQETQSARDLLGIERKQQTPVEPEPAVALAPDAPSLEIITEKDPDSEPSEL